MLTIPNTGPTLGRLLRRTLPVLATLPLLAGCGELIVLDPAGDVARQQGNLVVISTALMLLIVAPVMAATAWFAWKYRAANTDAKYTPDWDHSTQLELLIWAAPLLIIICLGALTWVSTHLLDPYRPLSSGGSASPAGPGQELSAPLEVQVVALDWKWLFIYPEQGIATVNEFAAPVDRPIRFRISGSSVMNSFYIPAMAGMIYAMPGMETKLHGEFDQAGTFEGLSAQYSGAGFSNMRFAVRSMPAADFDSWVQQVRTSTGQLTRAAYLQLEQPSEKVPPMYFAAVEPQLFDLVVNMCVDADKMCAHEMMAIDERGGLGLAGIHNVRRLAYDKYAGRGSGGDSLLLADGSRYVQATCLAQLDPVEGGLLDPVNLAPLTGAGLSRPSTLASL
ncbi:ubiquinol oxidase subunit II [Croceibacterium sp. TMG7-5b_MA50]|uniref:ubiquinol oxidase subunit II n=1 Tax=Croceibacterium sp. TMG7-5b_MA50 TaxID=3121290 RepID=UPI0032218445